MLNEDYKEMLQILLKNEVKFFSLHPILLTRCAVQAPDFGC